jgi:hypothetical protein
MYDEASDTEPRASTEMNSFPVEVSCYQAKIGKDQLHAGNCSAYDYESRRYNDARIAPRRGISEERVPTIKGAGGRARSRLVRFQLRSRPIFRV